MTMRTKTIAAINAKAEELGIAPEELMTKVQDFIDNLCGMDEKEAKKLIIQLKVTPCRPLPEETDEGEVAEATEGEGTLETAEATEEKTTFVPKYLEDILEENGIGDIGIENISKVLGDAAAFYKEAHPDCWLAGKVDEYPEELRKAVKDITLLSFIKEKCKKASYFTTQDVDKILRLTADERENKRFGGLKALSFPFNVATHLKDSANLIGKYFQTFLPEPMNRIEIPADFVPSPEPEKAVVVEQKAYNLPNAEAKAEAPQEKEADKPVAIPEVNDKLDVQQIIEHSKCISAFLSCRTQLLKNGLDPDVIVRKAPQVRALLKAAKDL